MPVIKFDLPWFTLYLLPAIVLVPVGSGGVWYWLMFGVGRRAEG